MKSNSDSSSRDCRENFAAGRRIVGRTTADETKLAVSVVESQLATKITRAASRILASEFNDRIQDVYNSSLGALQEIFLVSHHTWI